MSVEEYYNEDLNSALEELRDETNSGQIACELDFQIHRSLIDFKPTEKEVDNEKAIRSRLG